MKTRYWLILPLLGIAYGSPYYYREDKHHSQHHKEYSYSNGQPTELNKFESTPQKYFESSHFSSHVTPERYYKLETSPTFSSGFSQYSGGQSSYQSGFQSSGMQNSHLIPLSSTGQNLNIEEIKPGAYMIKQVKFYGQPSAYSTQTGFYGSTHNSKQEARELETGQEEENLYEGQEEDILNGRVGDYIKKHTQMTSLYHQRPQETNKKEESLYERKIEEVGGQKEESLYNQHIEDLGQHQKRGDLEIGQVEQNLNIQNPHVIRTIQSSPLDDGKGYKYYEKRIITYGNPSQDSSVNKQTYIRHETKHTELDGSLKSSTINQQPVGYVNIGSRQYKAGNTNNQEIFEQEKKLTTNSNIWQPSLITQPNENIPYKDKEVVKPFGHQTYTKSQEVGQEELLYGQHSQEFGYHTTPGSLEIGQQPEGESLDIGQQPVVDSLVIGQQPVVDNLDIGQQPVVDNLDIGQQPVVDSLVIGQQPVVDNLYIRQQPVVDSLVIGQQQVAGSLEIGQQTVPDHLEIGQIPVPGSLEIGQQPDNEGQKMENGDFELGQEEERDSSQQVHTWQRQESKSKYEINGQRMVPIRVNQGQALNHEYENSKRLITGTEHNSHGKPHTVVKQNVTETFIVSQILPTKPKTENIWKNQREQSKYSQNIEAGLKQREENVGQQEETLELGQHSENFQQLDKEDQLVSQKEVHFQIPERDKLELGQKEVPIFDTQPSKDKIKSSYTKTYQHHESYHSQLTPTNKHEDVPTFQQKYEFSPIPRSGSQDNINKNHQTNYLELQRKAEELALQLGIDDNIKEKSSKQEIEFSEVKVQSKEWEPKTSTEVYAAEIQELGLEKEHNLRRVDLLPYKPISLELQGQEHGLNYPVPSLTSYSSKKHSKHALVNHGYSSQPISQNFGFPDENHPPSQYNGHHQGYLRNGGEATYISDQPFQRSHTSGSQFSFSSSSSGSSQDKHKEIDDFLKELDKDISRNNYQQRHQQGSYAEVTPISSGSSGMSYYSQISETSHSSSSGITSGGDSGKAWYQRIGESIGSSYNQAKDKAKDIVKTVKQSVGYSSL